MIETYPDYGDHLFRFSPRCRRIVSGFPHENSIVDAPCSKWARWQKPPPFGYSVPPKLLMSKRPRGPAPRAARSDASKVPDGRPPAESPYAPSSQGDRGALEDLQCWQHDVLGRLSDVMQFVGVFDHTPDVVFSIKDQHGRYVAISAAIVERCSLPSRVGAIGKTAFHLFPQFMAARYTSQDQTVFRTHRPLYNNLDLTLYRDGTAGWCLTTKVPLLDRQGEVTALACLSRDLTEPSRGGLIDEKLAATVDYVQSNYNQRISVRVLASMAGLSETQLDRRLKRIFSLSTQQFIIKTRLSAATQQLDSTNVSIADVAAECGFCDQAAFANQFRRFVGLSPSEYRKLRRYEFDKP